MSEIRQYRPSNSDEGFWFTGKFCANCVHGKGEHDPENDTNPCEILLHSLFDEAKEWIYGEDGKPTCTAFKKWKWEQDEDGNWIDPPPPPDPNQLSLNL